ncbi:MAG: DNRLRE domain-containing protein [Planctomycetes bacterium]|nr:DNRLRE domain-containing protein [Planctomycetota bacterium]
MPKKLIYLVSFVVSVLSLISSAQAGEATTDTFVRGAENGDTNYGNNSNVTIKNANGNSYDRKAYIRFDIAGSISEASLDLTVSTNNNGGGGTIPQTFTVEVFGLAESLDHTWTETDITWNNAPGNDTSSSNFTEDATLLGSFIVDPIPAGNIVSFSDPALVDFINSDTDNQITILLRRTAGTSSSHNLAFASKESTSGYSAPTLNARLATQAYRPNPADGSLITDTWTNLSWRALDSAVSHDVYIGDNLEDVKAGVGDSFQGNLTDTTLLIGFPGFPFPNGLVPGTTYYWRIDEVNEAEPNSPWKGDVWSFSVPPKTAYFPDPADGADSLDVDVKLSWTPGYGAKLHTVYFGETFDEADSATGGQAQGTAAYSPGTLKMAKTYYWRVDEFDIVETYKGNVWSFITEGAVSNPVPANGDVDVSQTATLTWTPGVFGASHEIYFGTDADSLELKGSGNLGSKSYNPGQLEWNTTYYWRVDEANNTNADSPWTGPLWSFATANFLIIDDFESYNDLDEGDPASNRIYLAWADGFDNPAINGSVVGNANAPFAEQTIVHGDLQSMPMSYDNAVGKSEATLTLTSNRDWTFKGLNTLTIWFRGSAGNAAENLYVALNGSAVVNNDNPNAAQVISWTEWNIDLQAFADQGVDLTNVNSITIGLGDKNNPVAGGTGMMYFDDIRLYALQPQTP